MLKVCYLVVFALLVSSVWAQNNSQNHGMVLSMQDFVDKHAMLCNAVQACQKYYHRQPLTDYELLQVANNTDKHIYFESYLMPWFNVLNLQSNQFFPEFVLYIQMKLPAIAKNHLFRKKFQFGLTVTNPSRNRTLYLDQELYSFKYPKKPVTFVCSFTEKQKLDPFFLTEKFETYNSEKSPEFPILGSQYCFWNKMTKKLEAFFMFSSEWPIDLTATKPLITEFFFQYDKPLKIDTNLVKVKLGANSSKSEKPTNETNMYSIEEGLQNIPKILDDIFTADISILSESFNSTKQTNSSNLEQPLNSSHVHNVLNWNSKNWPLDIFLYKCSQDSRSCLTGGPEVPINLTFNSICVKKPSQCNFVVFLRAVDEKNMLIGIYLKSTIIVDYLTLSFSPSTNGQTSKSSVRFHCFRKNANTTVNVHTYDGEITPLMLKNNGSSDLVPGYIYHNPKVLHCRWIVPISLSIDTVPRPEALPVELNFANSSIQVAVNLKTDYENQNHSWTLEHGLASLINPVEISKQLPQNIQQTKKNVKPEVFMIGLVALAIGLISIVVVIWMITKKADENKDLSSETFGMSIPLSETRLPFNSNFGK